jgi:membrane protein
MKEWSARHLRLLKEAYGLFGQNHPIKFASAIAYFSLFALPCILLIITWLIGLFVGEAELRVELREQLAGVVGRDGADILITIMVNFREKASESLLMTLVYTGVVLWLSTQFFRLFQNALNDLWHVRPDFQGPWRKMLMERGLSFVLVLGSGVMFFASWIVQRALGFVTGGLLDVRIMQNRLVEVFTDLLAALLVFLWFALLYKVLPFVRIRWGPTLVGAAFTTVLFFIGVALLWQGVVKRDLEEFYAEVSPIILVALWMFYSALIFLFGASYTLVYARAMDKHILPASYAHRYERVRVDDPREGRAAKGS